MNEEAQLKEDIAYLKYLDHLDGNAPWEPQILILVIVRILLKLIRSHPEIFGRVP